MQKNSTGYMYVFALVITLGCGVLLAVVSEITKEARIANVRAEKMSNILSTVNYNFEPGTTNEEIEVKYKELISELVVDNSGNIIEGDAFDIELKAEKKKDVGERQLPVFVFDSPEGGRYYVLPMRGNGLWGAVWGYMSLASDFQTVYGVKFDHESETPGLGAEITTDWFQGQFADEKKVFDEDNEVALTILKGKGNELDQYTVDGISGATITGTGVSDMIQSDLAAYKAYFSKEKNS